MEEIKIKKLQTEEGRPIELLLLADPSLEMINTYIDKSNIFIAKVDNKIIGVIALLLKEQLVAEIINIAVDELYQGRGIGKRLIHYAIEYSKTLGLKRIEIGTGNSSLGQLALYQKCGFEIMGIDKGFFTRNYSETIIENGIVCKDRIILMLKL